MNKTIAAMSVLVVLSAGARAEVLGPERAALGAGVALAEARAEARKAVAEARERRAEGRTVLDELVAQCGESEGGACDEALIEICASRCRSLSAGEIAMMLRVVQPRVQREMLDGAEVDWARFDIMEMGAIVEAIETKSYRNELVRRWLEARRQRQAAPGPVSGKRPSDQDCTRRK